MLNESVYSSKRIRWIFQNEKNRQKNSSRILNSRIKIMDNNLLKIRPKGKSNLIM